MNELKPRSNENDFEDKMTRKTITVYTNKVRLTFDDSIIRIPELIVPSLEQFYVR